MFVTRRPTVIGRRQLELLARSDDLDAFKNVSDKFVGADNADERYEDKHKSVRLTARSRIAAVSRATELAFLTTRDTETITAFVSPLENVAEETMPPCLPASELRRMRKPRRNSREGVSAAVEFMMRARPTRAAAAAAESERGRVMFTTKEREAERRPESDVRNRNSTRKGFELAFAISVKFPQGMPAGTSVVALMMTDAVLFFASRALKSGLSPSR